MKLTARILLGAGLLFGAPAMAEEAPPAAAAAPAPAPAAAPAPATLTPTTEPAAADPAPAPAPARTGAAGAGLGLSPNTPQIAGGTMLSDKAAESLTPTTSAAGSDEWKFDFHGYMRGPMRVSWGPKTPTMACTGTMGCPPESVPSGTQLHSWPRVPGASYIEWNYTNTMPGPWAQLNFSYGNSRAMMTVIVDSYSQTSGGYRDLQAQQGIDQAFITLNFPEAFGDRGGLVLNVGTFQNRYGAAGKYDAGMYETYLFGRTHVSGLTATANIDTGSEWGLTFEGGGGSKIEIVPFTNNQLYQIFKSVPIGGDTNPSITSRESEYLPYAGPVPQGSTFLLHGHAGLAYKKLVTFGAHLLYTWTPDDNWDPVNSSINNVAEMTSRANGPVKGSMTIFGGDVRLALGAFGDGYAGYSHVGAKDINALADSIEVLHSFGGWQFKQNFFGKTYDPHTGFYQGPQTESGTVDTIEAQYTFSFGALARYPENFWGQGPDLALTAFGMLSIVKSELPPGIDNPLWDRSTKKLKFGADVAYTPYDWFGMGARFDVVQPDLDAKDGGSDRSFNVISPRIVIRTAFVTHEALTLMYQHYILGGLAHPVYPYEWAPKSDANVFALAGTMWW